MLTKKEVAQSLAEVKDILHALAFAQQNDKVFPMVTDLMEINKAKALLNKIEVSIRTKLNKGVVFIILILSLSSCSRFTCPTINKQFFYKTH